MTYADTGERLGFSMLTGEQLWGPVGHPRQRHQRKSTPILQLQRRLNSLRQPLRQRLRPGQVIALLNERRHNTMGHGTAQTAALKHHGDIIQST